MKSFVPAVAWLLVCVACASNTVQSSLAYRDDGLPMWVDEVFTDPRGLWSGYNRENGFYASGKGTHADSAIATKIAMLDAKANLAQFATGSKTEVLFGMRQVDRFLADDGTVYVLMFVSAKDVKRSTKR